MRLDIVTIVLNGMPWIAHHFPVLNSLTDVNWTWHVVEGAADNVKDTRWCKKPSPGLSTDGTAQFLDALRSHPRVRLYRKPLWAGKVEMVNTPLLQIKEKSVLMQIDSDEIWTAENIRGVIRLFKDDAGAQRAKFLCRYFLGPNIVTTTPDAYGNNSWEWLRAWRFQPGMSFATHEPPDLKGGPEGPTLTREFTLYYGLTFDHYAYVLPKQVEAKEHYYGYKSAVAQWKLLQLTKQWPVTLRTFLAWADMKAQARNLY